jgi:Flp pilus assembly pilin Flp
MKSQITRFLEDESGAGLVEYTILVAFVMVTIMGLASGYHASIAGVEGVTNSNLTAAASVLH